MIESIYQIVATNIDGQPFKLSEYKGKVVLIVNVASRCGFTPQYEGLEKIYLKYKDKGFVILGFPANNFFGQEPGTDKEIKAFCTLNYNVTFPMFSKVSVIGKDINPLYAYLTGKDTDPTFAGKITWNFNKFLIDRSGNIAGRFDTKVTPEDPKLTGEVEKYLAQ